MVQKLLLRPKIVNGPLKLSMRSVTPPINPGVHLLRCRHSRRCNEQKVSREPISAHKARRYPLCC